MPAQEKVEQVKALKERLGKSTIAISTSYVGLGGATMTDFRAQLRAKGLEYTVVKNTLAAIAAEQAGLADLKAFMQGPTGLALAFGDPIAAAKALDDYVKATRSSLVVRGAIVSGRAYSPADLARLLTLPPKPVLLAQLMGQMQAPMAGLVGTLNTPITNLVYTLNQTLAGVVYALQARVQQMQSQGAKS